jgi:lactoylglutathione lyase
MAKLTLLVLRCPDLELSQRFYTALGLVFTKEQHGTGPVHYSCQLGSTVLELYPANSTSSSVRLGIAVPDIAAAVESVRSLGFRVDREPTAEQRCVIRDPHNNPVELCQASDEAAQQGRCS